LTTNEILGSHTALLLDRHNMQSQIMAGHFCGWNHCLAPLYFIEREETQSVREKIEQVTDNLAHYLISVSRAGFM
jgi:hypothetical protein